MTTHPPSPPAGLILPSYERPSGLHPPLDSPGYRSTALRAPSRPLLMMAQRLTEITGPVLGEGRVGDLGQPLRHHQQRLRGRPQRGRPVAGRVQRRVQAGGPLVRGQGQPGGRGWRVRGHRAAAPSSWACPPHCRGREAGSLRPAVQLAQCGELGRGGRLEHFQRIRHGELPAGLGRRVLHRHHGVQPGEGELEGRRVRLQDAQVGDDLAGRRPRQPRRSRRPGPSPNPTEVTKSTRSTNDRRFCRTTTITSRHDAAISGAPPAPGSRTAGRA